MHNEYLGLSPRIASKFKAWKTTSANLIKLNTLLIELEKLDLISDESANYLSVWETNNIIYIQVVGEHPELEYVLSKIKARFNCVFKSKVDGDYVTYRAKDILGSNIRIDHYPTDCPTKEIHVPATTRLVVDCGANL